MARTKILYIELKTGYSDNGPAWIGKAKLSKSGQTVYFNGKALKHLGSRGVGSNHYDLETQEEYWVSGFKKNGEDRHWIGSGKIMIEADVVAEYLTATGQDELDKSHFKICHDIVETDPSTFYGLENA